VRCIVQQGRPLVGIEGADFQAPPRVLLVSVALRLEGPADAGDGWSVIPASSFALSNPYTDGAADRDEPIRRRYGGGYLAPFTSVTAASPSSQPKLQDFRAGHGRRPSHPTP